MMIMRAFLGSALALVLGLPVASQEPPAAPNAPATMQPMMDCMHMHGDGAGMPQMPMQGMSPMQGPGMMGSGMSGMPMTQGMPMMPPAQNGTAASAPMPMGCGDCACNGAAAAILGPGVGMLGLTAEQNTELDAIVARAREAALAVLTPEQRARIETQAATPGGMCGMMPARSGAETGPQP
jgi:hypothetical protein